jgi:Fe-S oxidoreductase
VKEAYPEFSGFTAANRLEEARSTGAEALVSSCPWCKSNFTEAAAGSGGSLEILDVIDLVQKAVE